MVFLDFQVEAHGDFEQVWRYFLDFENISDWDPNTKSCKVIRKNEKEVGSIYEIVSIFNGNESVVTYETLKYEITKDEVHIKLQGKNQRITADDEIICKKKGQKITTVIYQADICLRGVLCLFTPFVKGGLQKLETDAREGCVKKCVQKWGNAKAIK